VEEASWLEHLFVETEVVEVLKGMDNDKAPCLDCFFIGMDNDKAPCPECFSMAFFQVCWNVIDIDILRVLHDFHAYCKFERRLNAMFIALKSNKSGAINLKIFWPFSFVSEVIRSLPKSLAIS
jgi:hypothetical protein